MSNDICRFTDLDREICHHCNPAVRPVAVPTAPTKPGLYPDIPESVYHGDPNSLSSTGARLLVKPGGGAKFRFGEHEDNDDFDIGTAAHTLLLGAGAGIEVVDAKTWQGAAANAARVAARAAGKVPLLTKQYEATKAMVDTAMSRPQVAELLMGGVSEMSAYALDPDTWVLLRARFDYLIFGEDRHVTVVDYKTTKDAAPRAFERSAWSYGYHVQEAHYRRVLALLGYIVDRFVFIAQEKTRPFLVCVHEFVPSAVQEGDQVVSEAAELFAQYSESGEWPGYGSGTHFMSLPSWRNKDW